MTRRPPQKCRMPGRRASRPLLLRRQLEAMDDGGLVVLAVPASPSRCPPAPYERASLIAHYLKAKKPRSKILILDAKDAFPQQRLFENAWKELYPGMIERISLSQGGRVVSVDPATNTLVTDFGNYHCQGRQRHSAAEGRPHRRHRRRGRPHRLVPDRSGDVCLEARAQYSRHRRRLHRRRHSQIRLRRQRRSQGLRRRDRRTCSPAKSPAMPRLNGACYNTVAPGYAFSLSGIYQPKDDIFAEIDGSGSPARSMRRAKSASAKRRMRRPGINTITVETFG